MDGERKYAGTLGIGPCGRLGVAGSGLESDGLAPGHPRYHGWTLLTSRIDQGRSRWTGITFPGSDFRSSYLLVPLAVPRPELEGLAVKSRGDGERRPLVEPLIGIGRSSAPP